MEEPIPTLDDWGLSEPYPYRAGYDAAFAFHMFYRKSLEDVQKRIPDNPYGYGEAFYYVPDNICRFYFTAFVNYLQTEESKEDSDSVLNFLHVIKQMSKAFTDGPADSLAKILAVLEHIAESLDWYDLEDYPHISDSIAESKQKLSNA